MAFRTRLRPVRGLESDRSRILDRFGLVGAGGLELPTPESGQDIFSGRFYHSFYGTDSGFTHQLFNQRSDHSFCGGQLPVERVTDRSQGVLANVTGWLDSGADPFVFWVRIFLHESYRHAGFL